jgi:hypothetical protein
MRSERLIQYWQASDTMSKAESKMYADDEFGRDPVTTPDESLWTISRGWANGSIRAWPDGMDDPGMRAISGHDLETLHDHMAAFERSAERWAQNR